ncbi:MAG TPA: SLC13 family permease, partial [Sedimenticola sp.]|nr:SLC13 family permease [Sedimenticola sp.]
PRHAQLRLMAPVALISAFLNNTPVVAMFIPAVVDWVRRYRLSLSRLMIPLSYASIAGGTCTLIGSSTNLVVNSLLVDRAGMPALAMFDLAWIGVPIVVLVFLFILAASHWLLPERVPAISRFDDPREYTVEMLVETGSALAGKRIEEAGLRQLPGMFLMEIERRGRVMPAVSPRERLQEGDRLVFVGVVESVVDLQRIRGLRPASDQLFKLASPREDRVLVEAVVSDSCPLVGLSVRDGHFRNVYNAVIIAVARNGERLHQKIGDIVLRPGDTLLLESHRSFAEQQHNSRDFFLVSRIEDATPVRHDKALIALAILALMVVSVAAGWLSMMKSAMLAAGLMILTRCINGARARRSVDWQVLIVIAASFGLGNALQGTGAAGALAGGLVGMAGAEPLVTLMLLFLTTALLTAIATNNAAAVIMFPIALSSAASLGVSPLPFVVTLMVGASASFATPIGYQTNLMVYGVGGYRFSDYLRIGIPLTLLVGLVTLLLVPAVWPWN